MLGPLGSLRSLLVPMLLGSRATLDGMQSMRFCLLARLASLPSLTLIADGLS